MQKVENPSRRGMIRPSANGHAFQYADGTPYLLIGDTWWAAPTFRFRWRDDDTLRALGPEAGFKEFVAYRRKQGFNCVAILAALPNWANDDRPATLRMADGQEFVRTLVRIENNRTEGDPGLVAPQNGDFRLKNDSAAMKLGFKPIPVEKIGLYQDEYR